MRLKQASYGYSQTIFSSFDLYKNCPIALHSIAKQIEDETNPKSTA
jgi:hypothetical protein